MTPPPDGSTKPTDGGAQGRPGMGPHPAQGLCLKHWRRRGPTLPLWSWCAVWSYNQCCGIGPFLSIFNPQISACCSGVTLFGTLPRAHSFQLHSTTDPHIAFWEGPESPVWPLRCVPIKVHHLMPVVSQYGSWDTSRPLCLCSHCSLSVNTHPSYSYLLPLFFSHLLEDPAQSSPQGSLLVWHQMKAYLLSAPSALAFLVSALCFHFGGLPVCMMLYQQSPGVSCHSSRGEQE